MFDIGFTELLVIGVVALIVVGPKDLPGMFRTLGRFTARARKMGREFSQAMNDAADESGAKDIADTLKKATSPKSMGLDALNKAADGFEKWDPSKALKEQKAADAATKPKSEDKPSDLDPERADVARKIREATAQAATKRKAAEAANAEADAAAEAPAPKAAPKPKAKAKKPAAKKPAAKSKKPATKPASKAKPKSTDTSDA